MTHTLLSADDGSAPPSHPPLPENGQVVEVRGSTWAVTDIREQRLTRSSPDEGVAGLQHVVTLQALGEDTMGEELRVVWELEVGQTVLPPQGLPEHLTVESFAVDPNTLGAYVDAARWGAVTSADDKSFQAPFRAGVDIQPFQLEPLRRALQAPRTNLLLADDVGLGKTIEAGLVIQELLLRHRARTVVIVCPPSLALKWQAEMRDKFGLDFVIVNSERMADLRRSHGLAANPFRLSPRTIVSMAWLRSVRAQRLLRAVYPSREDSARRFAFDILVVDEAHHVAPAAPSSTAASRGYAVDSLRTQYTRELASYCEHRLFLSATPHNGHTESFMALMEMIDDRRFARGASVDADALKDVTVRRLKRDITSLHFQPRRIEAVAYDPEMAEEEHFAQLAALIAKSRQRSGQKGTGDLVGMLLKKRLLSSPYAFGRTLAAYLDSAARGSATQLEDDDEVLRETVGSEASEEEEGLFDQPEYVALQRRKVTQPLVAASREELESLAAWGLAYEARPDARLRALIRFLDGVTRAGTDWLNERVVVFTEYADTVDWMKRVLTAHGYNEDRLAVIQGSTDAEQRELIRQRFTADPADQPVRVLLATDSAGEGIDLQTYCHRLVNFDIPWNPSRLEQRIGRIDRYGQQHAPEVFHFVATDTGSSTYAADLHFLSEVAKKVSAVARDLGSVNQVVDFEIQDHFVPKATRQRPTDLASEGAAIINKTLAGGLELNRQLDQLTRTYEDTLTQLHLTPTNAQRVVEEALQAQHQPPLIPYYDESLDGAAFEIGQLSPPWHRSIEGLSTMLDQQRRPIVFDARLLDDPETGKQRSDLVHIHLGHPFLQRSARILRQRLLVDPDVRRAAAVVLPDLDASCVAALARLVLVGRGGIRLHEEVFVAGARIGAQNLALDKTLHLLDRALDAGAHQVPPRGVLESLASRWESGRLRDRLDQALEARAETLTGNVSQQLQERQEADLKRAGEIFQAFRVNLTESIDRLHRASEEQEAMLFTDDQQRQRRRDIRAMEERLDLLGDEEAREAAAIRARYTDVQHYVFPVAVVFALTPEDAKEQR